MATFEHERRIMVQQQLMARDIHDPRIIKAMLEVPREQFVRTELRDRAYHDGPLPIGEGQTISQPYMVAYMAQILELQPTDRVLEVGAGSGYAAAVMSRIASVVYVMELHRSLVEAATQRMQRLGYENVHVMLGDGSRGLPEHAPFDAISVAAGGTSVPVPLRQQLAIDGYLVIPVGATAMTQKLLRIHRISEDSFTEESLGSVHFVPLVHGSDSF